MLEFFIQNAWAQEGPQQGGGTSLLIMMVIFFVIMYFMIIRPQMKQAKEHKQMVDALTKGDEVVTTGGLVGKITRIGDSFLHIEVAPDVEVKVQKHAVSATLPKGTIKTI